MDKSYLAFDLGAGSGRAVAGSLSADNRLQTTVVHRFSNDMVPVSGHLHWNVLGLFHEMLHGLRLCAEKHEKALASIAVDTWGVDFALIDAAGGMLGNPYCYRDRQTDGAVESFSHIMPLAELYDRTGIQIMPINSVFQLHVLSANRSPQLFCAGSLLFMPDLFNYFFSGVMKSEFTFATTSQLYNPTSGNWDSEILKKIGIDRSIMQEIVQPASRIGTLLPKLALEAGLSEVPIVSVASHDTGSAIAAMPSTDERAAYISSGTWSLMGIETAAPIISTESCRENFTNEGGVGGTFRFLKNIMGMWLLEECRRVWSRTHRYNYADLTNLARASTPFASIIDPDRREFLNPANMVEAIADCCKASGQPPPAEVGATVRCILESLALDYRYTLEKIVALTGRKIDKIHILGGGSQNVLLNQLTADATGLSVHAGPVEATAIGNILVQAMAHGRIASVEELRQIVRDSCEIALFAPQGNALEWEKAYKRFVTIKQQLR